jgi:hypothetical protein
MTTGEKYVMLEDDYLPNYHVKRVDTGEIVAEISPESVLIWTVEGAEKTHYAAATLLGDDPLEMYDRTGIFAMFEKTFEGGTLDIYYAKESYYHKSIKVKSGVENINYKHDQLGGAVCYKADGEVGEFGVLSNGYTKLVYGKDYARLEANYSFGQFGLYCGDTLDLVSARELLSADLVYTGGSFQARVAGRILSLRCDEPLNGDALAYFNRIR